MQLEIRFKMKNNIIKRLSVYLLGLFMMTIGVSLSVKSNLGVSPISSIPYTITCVWGIEMGKATILFHVILVFLQILLLRKKFKPKNLLQIVIGIVFGYFTTFCNWSASFLLLPENFITRITLMLISTVFVAFGIFLYMPANIMPLAGEGIIQAISDVTGIDFPKVKIGFDVSMVLISLTTCLCFIKNLGSVGIGTAVAAVLVGTVLGFISKKLGKRRDRFLGTVEKSEKTEDDRSDRFVITIAREYGSCGREIGKKVAESLGIDYYDLDIIREAAKGSNTTEKEMLQNDQTIKNSAAQLLYYWCVQPASASELPIAERIYHAQEQVIRKFAQKGSCVIVGKLSNFILSDYNGIKIFIGADMESKIKKVMERDHLNEEEAVTKIEKVENERENHCYYFTHKHWKDISNYDFYIKSDILGVEQTVELIVNISQSHSHFKHDRNPVS